eukprot:1196108-Prorocentrum_minimum.AAC.2
MVYTMVHTMVYTMVYAMVYARYYWWWCWPRTRGTPPTRPASCYTTDTLYCAPTLLIHCTVLLHSRRTDLAGGGAGPRRGGPLQHDWPPICHRIYGADRAAGLHFRNSMHEAPPGAAFSHRLDAHTKSTNPLKYICYYFDPLQAACSRESWVFTTLVTGVLDVCAPRVLYDTP